MNVDLLERVRTNIFLYPERFCAAHWAFSRNTQAVVAGEAQPRGFKCCIAGHVLLQSGEHDEKDLLGQCGFHDGGRLWERAGDALGLTTAQRTELFFPSQWDQPHKQRYYLCSSAEEAGVCAAYIDYFISKHARPSKAIFERTPRVAAHRAPRADAPAAVPALVL